MATAASVVQLVEVLEGAVNVQTARSLLQQANGSIEGALDIHYGDAGPSQPAPIVEAGATETESQLRQILGPEPRLSYIRQLLLRFGDSVNGAVEAYYSDGGPPSLQPVAPVAPPPRVAPPRAAPVLAVDTSDSGEAGSTLQAVARRWLGRSQPAPPAAPAPAPAAPTSPRRSSFGRNIQPSRAQTARQATAQASSSSDDDDGLPQMAAAGVLSPEADITSDSEDCEPAFWTDTVGHPNRSGYTAGTDYEVGELFRAAVWRSQKPILQPHTVAAHKATSFGKVVPYDIPRNAKGELHVATSEEVPAKLLPKREPKLPLRLGTIHINLHVDTKMNVAQAVNQGMGKVLYLNTYKQNARGRLWVTRGEIRAKQDPKSRRHLLGHFGGHAPLYCGQDRVVAPYQGLAAALATLLDCEFITVTHSLRLTAAAAEGPGKGKQRAAEPADGAKSSVRKPPSHEVRLDVLVHLTEAALECTSNRGGKELCVLFHYLLTSGSGCKVGPDCDGCLNLGHSPVHFPEGPAKAAPRAATTAPTAEAAVADAAGPSTSAAHPAVQALQSADANGVASSSAQSTPESAKAEATEVEQLLMAGRIDPDAPLAVAPRGLRFVPKRFQLQGLHWMHQRESTGDARGRGHLHLHPGWLQFLLENGTLLHFQRTGPYCLSIPMPTAPQNGTCGGLLCDFMGLGKTLETLMLVMSHPPADGWAVTDPPQYRPKAVGKKRKVRLGEFESYEAVPIKATLIVVPANLRAQWASEMQRHMDPDALIWDMLPDLSEDQTEDPSKLGSSYEEGGRRRAKRMKVSPVVEDSRAVLKQVVCVNGRRLHECDVVLATYEQIKKELGAKQRSPLLSYGFWRLVLDEAQVVANSNSQAAMTVAQIWRRHAWVVTGTPVTSTPLELQGMLEFLAADPFYENKLWDFMYWNSQRLPVMQQLLHGIMIRRTRAEVADQLNLKACSSEDRWIKLSPTERICYDRNLKDMRKCVEQIKAGGPASFRAHAILLKHFTQLRQACCHPQIVRSSDALMGGSEHLSMADIMGRLVNKGFLDYDTLVQKMVQKQVMHAATLLDRGYPDEAQEVFDAAVRDIAEGSKRAGLLHIADLLRFCNTDGGLLAPDKQPEGSFEIFQEHQEQPADEDEPMPDAPGPSSAHGSRTDAHSTRNTAHATGNDSDVEIGDNADAQRRRGSSTPNGDIAAHWPQDGASARDAAGQAAGTSAAGTSADGQAGGQAAAEGPAAAARRRQGKARKKAAAKKKAKKEEKVEMTAEEQAAHTRLRAWTRTHLDALEIWVYAMQVGRACASLADRELQLSPLLYQIDELRAQLNLKSLAAEAKEAAGHGGRQSKRQRDMGADEHFSAEQLAAQLQQQPTSAAGLAKKGGWRSEYAQLYNVESDDHAVDGAKQGFRATQALAKQAYKSTMHLHDKHVTLKALEKGKQAMDAAGPDTEAEQSDPTTCPICLDDPLQRAVTVCGHLFCSHCIHEQLVSKQTCPLCRTRLTKEDVFDAATDEDAAAAKQRWAVKGDYGTKVGVLVSELLDMRKKDPTGKAVIFSAWGRVLKLVASGLEENGIPSVSLLASATGNLDTRADAIEQFQNNPEIKAILIIMSTGGGAAGLTLTAANTVFLMEPSLSPGLEAQAAGRVNRLGQERATRVIRLLAQNTVEQSVLDSQKAKSHVGESMMLAADADENTVMRMLDSHPVLPN